jgi:2-keto-3-deoxy-L-rhamnonate aldolase RhmA
MNVKKLHSVGGNEMIGIDLRKRLADGDHLLMVNPNHVSSGLAGRLPEVGADLIFIDCEHGTAGFDEAREMARAARSSGGGAIVRPDSHQRSLITRYFNAGVDGVMVPLVNTADQARAIVSIVRYACPSDYEKKLVVAMVETVEAIGNLDEILKVEGIDVFFVGPGDLSQSMGYMPSVPRGQSRPREVLDLVETTLTRIRAAGKMAGTLVIEEDIAHWSRFGAQLLYCHVDPFLRDKVETMHSLARQKN